MKLAIVSTVSFLVASLCAYLKFSQLFWKIWILPYLHSNQCPWSHLRPILWIVLRKTLDLGLGQLLKLRKWYPHQVTFFDQKLLWLLEKRNFQTLLEIFQIIEQSRIICQVQIIVKMVGKLTNHGAFWLTHFGKFFSCIDTFSSFWNLILGRWRNKEQKSNPCL